MTESMSSAPCNQCSKSINTTSDAGLYRTVSDEQSVHDSQPVLQANTDGILLPVVSTANAHQQTPTFELQSLKKSL